MFVFFCVWLHLILPNVERRLFAHADDTAVIANSSSSLFTQNQHMHKPWQAI